MAILLALTGRDSLDVAPAGIPDELKRVLDVRGLSLEEFIPPGEEAGDLLFDVITGVTAEGENVAIVRSSRELHELAAYDGPLTVRTFRVTPRGPQLMTQETYSPDYMDDVQRSMISRGRARLIDEFGAEWYHEVRRLIYRRRA